MTDAPKPLSREELDAMRARLECDRDLLAALDPSTAQDITHTMFRAAQAIAALEAERDALQARNAQIDADNKASDFAYRQQQIADSYDGYGEVGEEDVPSNALYRGNSVGWIHSKAYNYGKSLGRVWDALNAAAAERDAAYARGLEDAAKVADKVAEDFASKDAMVRVTAYEIAAAIRALKPGRAE